MKRVSFVVSAALALQASATFAAGVPALAGHAPLQAPLAAVTLSNLPNLSASATRLAGLPSLRSPISGPAALPGLPPVPDWVDYDVHQYPNDLQLWVRQIDGWASSTVSQAETDAARTAGDANCDGSATHGCGITRIPGDATTIITNVVQAGQGGGIPIVINPPRPHDGI